MPDTIPAFIQEYRAMSQFYQSPESAEAMTMDEPPRTSAMAIFALVCSLIFCCPLTTIPGILFGVIAAITIKGSGGRKRGMGMAITAIVIGTLGTGLVAGVFFMPWMAGHSLVSIIRESYALVAEGPGRALRTGLGGDIAGFKASFHGQGAALPDETATAFLDELTARYGAFQIAYPDEQKMQGRAPMGQEAMTMPYILVFDSGKVSADAELIFADPRNQQAPFVMKLGWIHVRDEVKPDLRYPAFAESEEEGAGDDAPGEGAEGGEGSSEGAAEEGGG